MNQVRKFTAVGTCLLAGFTWGCSRDRSTPNAMATDASANLSRDLTRTASAIPSVGELGLVATFDGPMPTGVTVSRSGRVFVNFPRWGDAVYFTVAELKNGTPVAYPNVDVNRYDINKVRDNLVSVQSVVVDPMDRLWLLDTGSLHLGPAVEEGAKLVCVDLGSNKITKVIRFSPEVVPSQTYLNDVRFDLRRGKGGMAFITDSGAEGSGGIIVVDLASERSWRRLANHPSVKADPNFTPMVEGKPLMARPVKGVTQPLALKSDGIAISNDGKRLFYTPLASRRLSSVSVDALVDAKMGDAQVAATVMDLGMRSYASDGLESDAAGNLYLTDYEHNAVHRRSPDGKDEVLVQDPRLIWPDTLSVASDGYLYVTANQLDRQPGYHEGKDLRERPFALMRTKINQKPVSLR